MNEPRASVVIPTHDHDLTLPMAVASVLDQTVTDLEVLIVGDGVTAELRGAAEALASADDRVRFLDLPKGEHHGEVHRDLAVREARSNAIFYLCDDDVFLPRHIENLLPLLDHHDLVQCRNSFITQDGELVLYPTDLSDPAAVRWHLEDPPRNCISITGTAHRRDTYLALEEGWTVTPPGYWPDHYMWRKFLRHPGATAATHPDVSAIQLPTSAGRDDMDQRARAAELQEWVDRLRSRETDATWFREEVSRVTSAQLDRTHRDRIDAALYAHHLAGELQRMERTVEDLRAEADGLKAEADDLRATVDRQRTQVRRLRSRRTQLEQQLGRERDSLARLRASRSWKLTRPLRAAGGLVRRVRLP